ncbi:hypothetical protein NEOLEDRAFT_898580 [Neolentinus lepideus HHB14362 ss-1]|uniref:Uncharacterized protein n=1 Tax=Neolentinus lepideus HHB14362 ss-1 TaxID=1314782 RepID=A0A165NRQ1_9AGAM|nr:hypothetical protein NEOLEDRAFT_898580 [Neolentinus lepideus HHB14362 ss-1]
MIKLPWRARFGYVAVAWLRVVVFALQWLRVVPFTLQWLRVVPCPLQLLLCFKYGIVNAYNAVSLSSHDQQTRVLAAPGGKQFHSVGIRRETQKRELLTNNAS